MRHPLSTGVLRGLRGAQRCGIAGARPGAHPAGGPGRARGQGAGRPLYPGIFHPLVSHLRSPRTPPSAPPSSGVLSAVATGAGLRSGQDHGQPAAAFACNRGPLAAIVCAPATQDPRSSLPSFPHPAGRHGPKRARRGAPGGWPLQQQSTQEVGSRGELVGSPTLTAVGRGLGS